MRAYAKIVNDITPTPTVEELVGYSEQLQRVASITEINGRDIVVEAGSIESLLYAVNMLGFRKVILVILKVD